MGTSVTDSVKLSKEGVKYDDGKIRMELFPSEAIEEISKVLTCGAQKYDGWNWARGMAWSRVFGSTLRHLFAWAKGEDTDPETGISHLAHAGCNICFLLYYERHHKSYDDRRQSHGVK